MFKAERLTYIQMQKTGCTHIADLLSKIFEGEQVGLGGKKNTSARTLSISEYYTNELIDLVNNRDQLLIEKFGYKLPK